MGRLLIDLLRARGEIMDLPCAGGGRCGKCRVLARGRLAPPDAREAALLTPAELAAGVRLACQAVALDDEVIILPVEGASANADIVTRGEAAAFAIRPWAEGESGLAVDIGTTTIAAYRYRLADGALLGEAAAKNPQGGFGADVTSRLDRALAGDGPALAEAVRGCVALLAEELFQGDMIDAAVITGNTAMLYLLTGREPSSIAFAPFDANCLFGAFVSGADVGLPRTARAYLPMCMGAYVGADMTTAMLAAGLDRPAQAPRLLVDIGTNGEMALAVGESLLCCSTAAGPAFEGAGISCGMTARVGAVHRVRLEGSDIRCETLGGGNAVGICGSGLLDLTATLLDAGILDETGRLPDGAPYALPGTNLTITQADIRAVQLAKAALAAGMRTLLHAAGLAETDVAELIIAGGFGSRIDPVSAARIGLIPEGLVGRARAIGNAAGMGAGMVLLSGDCLRASETLRNRARVINLATDPFFQDQFIEEMLFPEA